MKIYLKNRYFIEIICLRTDACGCKKNIYSTEGKKIESG